MGTTYLDYLTGIMMKPDACVPCLAYICALAMKWERSRNSSLGPICKALLTKSHIWHYLDIMVVSAKVLQTSVCLVLDYFQPENVIFESKRPTTCIIALSG